MAKFKPTSGKKGFWKSSTKYNQKKVVKKAIKEASNKVFAAKVKNVLAKEMEVKEAGVRGIIQIVNFNGTNASNCDTINQILFDPLINQGTGEANRIGNEIKIVSCKMRYMLTVNSSDFAATVPTIVRMIWYYDRADNNSLPTPYQNANFINNGNSSTGFSGTIADTFYRYNTDRYRILGIRDHKLGFASSTGTGTVPQYQYFSNNDSSMIVKGSVDCTNWIIKRQKFNDNVGTSESRKLYCLVMTMAQTGNVWATTGPTNRIHYEVNYKFTDA